MKEEAIKLLVLDDELTVGRVINRIANMSNFDSKHVLNPEDFFAELEGWQPSHVAVDLVMPEMDGVEVIEHLAKLDSEVKVIVTSGVGSRVLDAAARSAEAHGLEFIGVLPKPFKPADLRSLLFDAGGTNRSGKAGRTSKSIEITADDIDRALKENEFSLCYQPKVDCVSEKVAGFEVLSRWIHPEHGFISPEYFIVKAEEFNLIDRLTFQVVEKSLRWFSREFPQFESDLYLSINMSGKNLAESTLIDVLPEYCENYGLSRERLILELTETAAMEDPVRSLDILTRLRVKDFHLSLDDFGTGFSSMLQLVKLPFSEIKIDKSFVFDAMKSEESRTVIEVTLDLARRLGLSTTAEGVEDKATFDYLMEQGCNLVQGYYFAKPLPPDEAVAWVQNYEQQLNTGTY
jgi:EAL domain-containing protein (putative c-di-GMP-specific phosphodiesterase class I)/FixJ family two-component response regulator